MNPIVKEIIQDLVSPVCVAALSAAGLVISRSLVRFIEHKFRIDLDAKTEAVIDAVVQRGVKAVEEMARAKAGAHLEYQPGPAKLEIAKERIARELKANGIEISEAATLDRIHDALDSLRNARN